MGGNRYLNRPIALNRTNLFILGTLSWLELGINIFGTFR